MYTITIEGVDDCNCYKRRGEELPQSFQTKFNAKQKAEELVEQMEDDFCGVHEFSIKEDGDNFIIEAKRVV